MAFYYKILTLVVTVADIDVRFGRNFLEFELKWVHFRGGGGLVMTPRPSLQEVEGRERLSKLKPHLVIPRPKNLKIDSF